MIHILHHQTDQIVGWLPKVIEDSHQNSIKNEESFDFRVSVNESDADKITSRSRILIPGEEGDYREFIVEYIHEKTSSMEKEVKTKGSFFDIRKAKIISPQVLDAQTIQTAAGLVLSGLEWQVGIVDYSGIRKWVIEKHLDAFEAIKAIASLFECELRFRVTTEGDTITGRYVDFIKKQGLDRGKEIVFGKDLVGITRKILPERIVTGLHCLGPEKQDGTRLEVVVTNDEAFQNWNRKGNHLIELYEPESTDEEMTEERLKQLGETELKKRISAAVEYEVEAASLEHIFGYEHEIVRLGDSAKIKDEHFNPPMYLGSRVIFVDRSIFNESKKTFKLGEVIEYTKEDVMKTWRELQALYATKVIKSASAPTGSSNVIWIDTSQNPNVVNTWNGTQWVKATPTAAEEIGAETPSGAQDKVDTGVGAANEYTDQQISDVTEVTDGLISRITTAESSITANANEIKSRVTTTTYQQGIQDAKDYADGAANAVQVGGRNLVSNTENEWVTTTISSNSAYGVYKNTGLNDAFASLAGKPAMASFEVKLELISGTTGTPRIYGSNGSPKYPMSWSNFNATNSWTRVAVPVTITAHATNTGESRIEFFGNNPNITKIYIRKFKLESGTRATDWFPSPEDVDNDIKKAQNDADTANSLLSDIASDSKLTPTEKQDVKKEWDVIVGEKSTIEAQATTFGITTEKTTYTNAYNALNTYISPLLTNLNTTSDIVGSTFRSTFKSYYDARTNLLKKVSDSSKGLIDNVDGRLSTAESTITQHANQITSKVSETDYNGNTIASKINQTATTVSIDAKKINLNGAVTISSFDSGTKSMVEKGDKALDEAKKYVNDNTGNLLNNTSVSGNNEKWSSSATVVNRDFMGTTIPTLQTYTNGDLQIYSSFFTVDPSKAYEVSLWMQASSAVVGTDYFGLQAYNGDTHIGIDTMNDSTGGISASASTNPYFWSGNNPHPTTGWIKRTAYIMPAGTPNNLMVGLGENISINARMLPNTNKIRIRYLNYYNAGTYKYLWVAHPKVVEVDPNAVLRGSAAKNSIDANKPTWDRASHINSNGTFNTSKLNGTLTDAQIASATSWNGAKDLLNSWKSGTTYINGGMIATNTIFAQQMAIGDFTNLSQIHEVKIPNGNTVVDYNGGKSFRIGTGAYDGLHIIRSEYVQFVVGDQYQIEYSGFRSTTSTTMSFTIRYRYTDSTWSNAGTVLATPSTADSRISKTIEITAAPTSGKTVNYVQFFFEKDGTAGSGYHYIRDISLRKRYGGQLLVDGAVSAGHISSLNGLNVGNGKLVIDGNGNVTMRGNLDGATGSFKGSLTSTDGSNSLTLDGYSIKGNGRTLLDVTDTIPSMHYGNGAAVLGSYGKLFVQEINIPVSAKTWNTGDYIEATLAVSNHLTVAINSVMGIYCQAVSKEWYAYENIDSRAFESGDLRYIRIRISPNYTYTSGGTTIKVYVLVIGYR